MSDCACSKSIVLEPTSRPADAETLTVRTLGRTHFIGIGGAGMSVLAEILHERGVEVQGSDRELGPKAKRLQSLGITVFVGQQAQNVEGVDTVVWSSAIKPDNPEIVAAVKSGARLMHRSDVLALLMTSARAVTVAGAHGKTTTSAMIAHILVHGGKGDLADPSYAIGGSIQGPNGPVDGGHAGKGTVLVAEADESDGSFAKYHPEIAVITNVEAEHLDHYGTAEAYRQAFVDHAHHATGHVVLCADDEGALSVLRSMDADAASRAVAYSTRPLDEVGDVNGAMFVHIDHEAEAAADDGSASPEAVESFTLHMPASLHAAGDIPVHLRIPGIHNARNATAAIIAATLLGMDPADAAKSAGAFRGAARRFEIRGEAAGVTVVDDYAHHPTEIAAMLDAARRRFPESTIRVLFQPHLFSRTKFFAHDFAEALSKADDVIVTCIFPARERQSDYPDISSKTVVKAAAGVAHEPSGGWIESVPDMCQAAKMLAMRCRPGDVMFTVGAGDITDMADVMLCVLKTRTEDQQ
ncbi:UDP-N-acetylmuramate--L-alanine ligase [Bifidobacterium sp. SMB2]|uniref:UDP-N-acetylmuramate--L-alanine ligase n=1 Tax=Bifidobacterium saimiriisciurei TaxID=2661627 RepID=A0ABX0C9J7_9BIFI|nr:UDP-N-acetylmuramate--L-alanine ligase [Bifidobacterium saimiriisciurei]NEG95969.1 UDP-N-acetylmuramate--L-alanine ligase [Bifidobacterium sp. SMB2]NEH11816.1 UDP-N-acetylmuramate--L-alanine ligase [Bifidobacterium saimiriisciurei]